MFVHFEVVAGEGKGALVTSDSRQQSTDEMIEDMSWGDEKGCEGTGYFSPCGNVWILGYSETSISQNLREHMIAVCMST